MNAMGLGLASLVFALLVTYRVVVRYPNLLSRVPRCSQCWYILIGVPSLRCPECGTALLASVSVHSDLAQREFTRLRARLTVCLLVVLVLMLLIGSVAMARTGRQVLVPGVWLLTPKSGMIVEIAIDTRRLPSDRFLTVLIGIRGSSSPRFLVRAADATVAHSTDAARQARYGPSLEVAEADFDEALVLRRIQECGVDTTVPRLRNEVRQLCELVASLLRGASVDGSIGAATEFQARRMSAVRRIPNWSCLFVPAGAVAAVYAAALVGAYARVKRSSWRNRARFG